MAAAGTARMPAKTRFSRWAYAALGCFFVAMGAIGVPIPGWPTTIFCILALWCFKKSSKKLEDWLLNVRYLGPALRDWDESRSMTARAKVISISAIWLCILTSIYFVQKLWVQVMLFGIAVALTWYLSSRPTKTPAIEMSEAA
jgi:uncharacterized membrane protein YbaN (DUF454 family)